MDHSSFRSCLDAKPHVSYWSAIRQLGRESRAPLSVTNQLTVPRHLVLSRYAADHALVVALLYLCLRTRATPCRKIRMSKLPISMECGS